MLDLTKNNTTKIGTNYPKWHMCIGLFIAIIVVPCFIFLKASLENSFKKESIEPISQPLLACSSFSGSNIQSAQRNSALNQLLLNYRQKNETNISGQALVAAVVSGYLEGLSKSATNADKVVSGMATCK